MSQSSRSLQPPRPLRPALAVTLALVLLSCPAAHAIAAHPSALRLPGLGEFLSPLVDLVTQFWEKADGGLDSDGAPAAAGSEEGSGLDPDGAH